MSASKAMPSPGPAALGSTALGRRRGVLIGGLLAALGVATLAVGPRGVGAAAQGVAGMGHPDPFGPVNPPQPAPALSMLRDDGTRGDLPSLLRGRVTAVQLMFTGCSSICPLQGALFAEVARRLPAPDARLLSLSIDPLADDAAALRTWLDRFGAPPAWRGAAPRLQDVDRLLEFMRGRSTGPDRHKGQVSLFDRQGRLVLRTPDLPPAGYVADLLTTLAQTARRR